MTPPPSPTRNQEDPSSEEISSERPHRMRNLQELYETYKSSNKWLMHLNCRASNGYCSETWKGSRLSTMQRRVVVTGMGVETSLGRDPDIFYNNLLEGVSSISEIEGFDCAQFPTVRAIKTFSTDGWVEPKQIKKLDKFMLYVLTTGKTALANGGITEEKRDAKIYAEFLGGSFTYNAYHMTEPHPEGNALKKTTL
ncbi:hypothetical protein RHSIM_Rhsim13G0127100 [Rhododendron simsii]|uniref:beta-ketoacyl-[acyl-carrier-protein] synthase I n=1 Tax=Rhododendron simsii TaxID=118357 RepID=A0A834L6A9_RHOSS|nr:hypothetical protein RHSIM_Rhsim13G0127100 [Rhododendron simsii]